ncbi:TPA: glycosyltransferase family 1 protein [bacterium]|nr:glycosyltransferase family 1 protein [bacterium]
MKVLVISHSAIQPTYHRKFEEVARYGDIEIKIIVPEKWVENTQELHFSQIDKGNLSFLSKKVAFAGYGSRFFFTESIIREFKEFKPDIIHLEEEPWSLCALQTIILRDLFCKKSKLIFRTSLSIPSKQRFNFIASNIEKLTFKKSDHAFVLSKRAGDILRKKSYNGDMSIGYNGVDASVFRKIDVRNLKNDLGIKDNECVIGYVGRLMKMKGIETLIRAFYTLLEQNPNKSYRLMLLGSGEYKEEMISIASELGIKEKIILIEAVPALDVPRYINCMDVLVLPSLTMPWWVEFFGRVLVEAMMCEVPVIGSDSGEIPNVIGDAGLIFHEGDENDLKEKLDTIINNSYTRDLLITRGSARASSMFTWESIARETYKVYCSLLNLAK